MNTTNVLPGSLSSNQAPSATGYTADPPPKLSVLQVERACESARRPEEPGELPTERVVDTGRLTDRGLTIAIVGLCALLYLLIGIALALDNMPAMAGIAILLPFIGPAVQWSIDREDRRFVQRAVRAKAQVLATEQTKFRVNNARVQQLRMRLTIPGQPPFIAIHRALVRKGHMPRIEPGSTLSVRVDPERLHTLKIDW